MIVVSRYRGSPACNLVPRLVPVGVGLAAVAAVVVVLDAVSRAGPRLCTSATLFTVIYRSI